MNVWELILGYASNLLSSMQFPHLSSLVSIVHAPGSDRLIRRLLCREDASTSAHAADAAAPVFPAVPPAVLAHGPGAVMETVALPPRVSAPATFLYFSQYPIIIRHVL
jgi:hypothetical protein